MNYNDGAVKDVTRITDKKKAAQDFAEGNIYLEELLNNCYDSGIITKACCAGHDKNIFTPYIILYFTKENENYINAIMSLLLNKGWTFEFSKGENSVYPAFYIKCPNSYDYDEFFIDLNDVLYISKNSKFDRKELDKTVKLFYDAILSLEKGSFSITCDNFKKTVVASYNGFYEVMSYEEPLLNNYLEYVIKNNIVEYKENKELQYYNIDLNQQYEQNRFQQFLDDNNIKLKNGIKNVFITKYGGYAKEIPIMCEIDVTENDSIFTIAEKLYKLAFFENIGAKAVVSGIDIVNNIRVESEVRYGKQLYENIFTIEDCVKSYEKIILQKLNSEYFNQELIMLSNSPFAIISFNNDNLTEEELTKRIAVIKKYKLDVCLNYNNINIGFGIFDNKTKNVDKDTLNDNILYSILGTDNNEAILFLLNLLLDLNNNDNIEDIISKYNNMGTNRIINEKNGMMKYLNKININHFADLFQVVTYEKIIPLIEEFKHILQGSEEYLDVIISKLNNSSSYEDVLILLNIFATYCNQNYKKESSVIK